MLADNLVGKIGQFEALLASRFTNRDKGITPRQAVLDHDNAGRNTDSALGV